MRLKSIKLSGFKSFVDPTTILLPTNLTAIVGPNGCGKSNVIDAVRWVMGESSAKQLRGQSLDDVIFNGSSARKPLGHASIELNFDNSSGRMQGPYASYSEIMVRREISRDGQSNYYLNNTRCRRRDITDLFLGTGLGPRSYAIIEQGMISRLIEAKPEDLRAYVEETAGISKYKERRHETELRISHTQENLARLNDIREELGKQIDHLQRQANAAEKYKTLKQEERLLRVEIYALRWRSMNDEFSDQSQKIQEYEAKLAIVTDEQQQLAEQLEQLQQTQKSKTTHCNELQEQFYQCAAEITRIEQSIQNVQERSAQWQEEQIEISKNAERITLQITAIDQNRQDLLRDIDSLEPQCQQTKSVAQQSEDSLAQAEIISHEWQMKWDDYIQKTAQLMQRLEVEQTRIQHVQQQIEAYQQRSERLKNEQQQRDLELTGVNTDEFSEQITILQKQHAAAEENLQAVADSINEQRQQNQHLTQELDLVKNQAQQLQGQKSSLDTLQRVALGQHEEETMHWLKQNSLAELPRLAQLIEVEAGWEQAAESVLARYLQAVCIDDLNNAAMNLQQLPQANFSLMARTSNTTTLTAAKNIPTLLSKIKSQMALSNILSGIYVAESLVEALSLANTLNENESVVTRDGIWLGHNWLSVMHKTDAAGGILQRERELTQLKQKISEISQQAEQYREALSEGLDRLHELEAQRDAASRDVAKLVTLQAEANAKHKVQQAHFSQVSQRIQQITAELGDCLTHLEADQLTLATAQDVQQELQMTLAQRENERESFQQEKNAHQQALESARKQAQHDREIAHQLELRLQSARIQLDSQLQNQNQLQQQLADLTHRQEHLAQLLLESNAPIPELASKLEVLNADKSDLDEQLRNARQQLQEIELQVQEIAKQRQFLEQQTFTVRNELEEARLAGQTCVVKSKNIEEQVAELGSSLETALNEISAEADEKAWEEKLNQVTRRIERLGPINLAAIDEFTTHSERKAYLDAQNEDLTQALDSLEQAIGKIDKETRARFKETFDQINANFQKLFPSLFGGGHASMQLNEEDLLSAGITVMAQPPGKRNSTIHLLSGGEKALTAISLVFAMFQLNPAPFCILDEVDAPLDDANVGRFCNLVKQMSNDVQFIFISHNKLAIEMAEQLAGVTMQEAGVSRLVAVDINEAIAMATA